MTIAASNIMNRDQPARITWDGTARPAGLIGGIGLTEVAVYAQRRAPDGLFSGCPHVHAITDEAYFVLAGTGRVEFHDLENGPRTVSLAAGHYLQFPPLVLHRLISDGDLLILGMMGNSGLAESGEARIYFGPDVDNDVSRFSELMGLPQRDGLAGALSRRDCAVSEYLKLQKLWDSDRNAYFAELRRFFALHCAEAEKKREQFTAKILGGPVAWGNSTLKRLNDLPALPNVTADVLISIRDAGERDAEVRGLGMCGVLRPVTAREHF